MSRELKEETNEEKSAIIRKGFKALADKHDFKLKPIEDHGDDYKDTDVVLMAENTSGDFVDWIIFSSEADVLIIMETTADRVFCLSQTRPNLTFKKFSKFIDDLNEVLRFPEEDKIIARQLITEYDWEVLIERSLASDDDNDE